MHTEGQNHLHAHSHKHDSSGIGHSHANQFRSFERKRLLVAIILTAAMMAGEIVGGLLSKSLALLSDAGHMLTHSFSLLVSFLAIRYACRPATKEKSFGFYRAEILAALFNGVTLIIITGFILWEAYKRLLNPVPIASMEMIIISSLGLVVNLATAVILWKAGRESLNIRSAFLHMIGDTASSIGVVIGAVIIYFTGFYIIDPIFSIIIALLILVWASGLIRDSVRILMESTPRHINVNNLKESLINTFPAVKGMHDLHVWEITTGMYCMSAHIAVSDMTVSSTEPLLVQINDFLQDHYNIQHPIIQFETTDNLEREQSCSLDDS
jgi:cobalt-zinc-cadmium efflux system protein